jgi:thiosulfate dehydrogenase
MESLPLGNSRIHLATRPSPQARFLRLAKLVATGALLCYSVCSTSSASVSAPLERRKGTAMKGFLVGLILGILIVPIALFFYIETGQAPAAASDAPLPFEKFLARGALHARIKREAQDRDLSTFNAGDLAAGAEAYRTNCAFCHGLPLQAPSAASQGMFPHAPQLFTAKETVTDDPVGVTYWKVKNGIRLTGMPGFQKALTDQQMWQVAALMASADKLPPDVLRSLLPAAAPANAILPAPGAPPAAMAAPVAPLPASPSQPQ